MGSEEWGTDEGDWVVDGSGGGVGTRCRAGLADIDLRKFILQNY